MDAVHSFGTGCGSMRRSLCLSLLVASLAAHAHAQQPPADTSPPLAAGEPPEWGVEAGYGFSVHLNRGRSVEHLLLLEPSVGLRLGSRFQYVIETHFAHYLTPHGYMIGVMPLGARYIFGRGRTLPYLSIGAGLGWTDLVQLEEIDRRFNFLLQASAGVRRAITEREAWTFEARLSHISNGGTELPNLGLNCLVFLAGFRFR